MTLRNPRLPLLPCGVAALMLALAGVAHAQAPSGLLPASGGDALPVRAVTLFSSGVGYTLREGEVAGDATVPLQFPTAHINDILKSLVLLDESGTVRPAVYAAKDPIGRTLQSFAVDVTQPTGRAELLNRLRGANVIVEAGGTVLAASTMTEKIRIEGQIVGVDNEEGATATGAKTDDSTKTTISAPVLTILGAAGLQSVRLSEVRSIRLLDERLNREFRAALGLLAANADDRRRQVTLHFDGQGRRRVRVGYVSEAPLWKISYRLLIGGTEGGDNKPYLQGWALVENTSDDDWNGVQLSLVSGRPISFIQDLYQPLYLPRPVVPPDVVASPFPQLAEANIEQQNNSAVATTSADANKDENAPAGVMQAMKARAVSRPSLAAPAPMMVNRAYASGGAGAADMSEATARYRQSVEAQATGTQAGELFQYRISSPVTLPRQQAAMIPVLAQDIAGEKVSLYNADSDARFPLNAFRLRNNTALFLKGGPVTLLDGGVYAGDARMEDIPPGDQRLITYAVDLAVQGERQYTLNKNVETTLFIRRGVLTLNRREHQEVVYTLKNKADKTRLVIVEHPYDAGVKLVAPAKADSRTPSHYRFEVTVAPGATQKLTVSTERPLAQSVALLNGDLNFLEVYTGRADVSEAIKAALRDILARRRRIAELQSAASVAEAEVVSIDRDQERIRKNMAALDRASALYKRYVTQLDTQETRIQSLRTEAARLRSAAARAGPPSAKDTQNQTLTAHVKRSTIRPCLSPRSRLSRASSPCRICYRLPSVWP